MTNTINQVMTEIVDISVKLGYKLLLLRRLISKFVPMKKPPTQGWGSLHGK
ncbi:MAG: hypothetical protein QXI38_02505 [Conexivisphaerales archaeon]